MKTLQEHLQEQLNESKGFFKVSDVPADLKKILGNNTKRWLEVFNDWADVYVGNDDQQPWRDKLVMQKWTELLLFLHDDPDIDLDSCPEYFDDALEGDVDIMVVDFETMNWKSICDDIKMYFE